MKKSNPYLITMCFILTFLTSYVSAAQSQSPDAASELCCCSILGAPFAVMTGIFAAIFTFYGIILLLILLEIVLVVYALYSCLTKEDWKNPNDKIAWVLVIIFFPLLGSIFFVMYNRKN
ncbi:MAG: PLD nuclease N-terminal domain-containing protein [Candidatus Altiarchaeota archaeon]|nr:PLD nuclease N-terminal domain-containing protein [Candidatus Altiarchaeota archaeon]